MVYYYRELEISWYEYISIGSYNGRGNKIGDNSVYSSIGGSCNFILGCYASILGGYNNTVSGAYSAILGGGGNIVSGYTHAGVFGQGVPAVANNTFHVECLNACNTPINSTSSIYPYGTIFALNGPKPTGSYPLYIQLI